jgi:hypothetical protein
LRGPDDATDIRYVKRLQAERSGVQAGGEPSSAASLASISSNYTDPANSPTYSRRDLSQQHYGSYPQLTASYAHPPPEGYHPPSGPGGTLNSQNVYGGSALAPPGHGLPTHMSKNINTAWDETLQRAVVATSSTSELDDEPRGYAGNQSRYAGQLSPNASTGRPSSASRPELSPTFSPQYRNRPSNPANPLDQVLPRGLLLHIVDLYFDYIYALVPAIHRPTFMRDLGNYREEREGEEEWTHMVLILVTSTLLQVPRAFVPLPRKEVRALAERCWHLVRLFLSKDYVEVSLERCE